MMRAQPINKTDNIYEITYDDNGEVGDVEWGARRREETESSSDSGEEDGPLDIKGHDPKSKQRRMVRYAATGVGIFLVCFFLIGGAMQVFSSSESESHAVFDNNAKTAGSASHEIDYPVREPESDEPVTPSDTEPEGSTNEETTSDSDIDEIEGPSMEPDSAPEPEPEPGMDESKNDETTSDPEGPPVKPESFVNVDPADVPAGAEWIMRVSAGATQDYTDPSGKVWLADNGKSKLFSVNGDGDKTYEDCPLEVEHADFGGPELYCNERYFTEKGGYEVPVPEAAIYEVSLYFADIFIDKPGERKFDVLVEDLMLHPKFDIVQAAGAGNTATTIQTTQQIKDGAVTIELRAHKQNSKISAFEVRRVADLP